MEDEVQPGQLQDSEYINLRSHPRPIDYENLSESGGERSKQSLIRLELCYSVLALRDAGHREYVQPPQVV